MLALSAPLHRAHQVARRQRGGDEEGEVAGDRLQRGRRVGGAGEARRPSSAGIASRNSSTATTGPSMSNALSVAGCSTPKRASTVLGPSRSVADWPGWNCVARLAHDLQVVDRRAGRGEQRQRLGLGVEGVERRGLAASPSRAASSRPPAPRQRRPLVARAAFAAQIAAADLEQPQRLPRRDRALRCAAASRPGSSEGRMAFMSSLIGLASVHSRRRRRRNASASARAGTTRSPPRSARARRRRGAAGARAVCAGVAVGPGDAVGARQGDAGDLVEPVDADDFLDDVGRRRRCRGGQPGAVDLPVAPPTREAERCRGCARCSASAIATPPSRSASAGS